MRKLTQEEAISKMNELQPDYNFDKFVYKGNKDKSIIVCSQGHEYKGRYNTFMKGHRCPYCAGRKHLTDPIQKMKMLEPSYDFSKFVYKNNYTKSTIICDNNHEFEVSYNTFVQLSSRCPHCTKHKSKPEFEIIDFIKTFYNGNIEQGNRSIIKNPRTNYPLEIDIYLPDIKLAIEFNGRYYHTDEMMRKRGWSSAEEHRTTKTKLCKDKDIYLIHIEEQEYISNKDKCLERIKNKIITRI